LSNSDECGRCDVVIIGAGIVGLAAAYHIKREHPSEKILVLEKAAGPGQGDTAKSVSAVRNVFSSEINRTLANTSIDFYESIQKSGTNLNLQFIGYLWLLSDRQYSRNEAVINEMRSQGVPLKLLEPQQLKEDVPSLNPVLNREDEDVKMLGADNVAYGLLGKRCGVIAAEKLVEFFEKEFRKLGGLVKYRCSASSLIVEGHPPLNLPNEPFIWQNKKLTQIQTQDRERVKARMVVVATGCWTHQLLDPIGLDAHMRPRKKQVFVLTGESVRKVSCSTLNESGTLPFTILPKSGVYLRPVKSENSLWVSAGEGLGHPFGLEENPSVDESYYTYNIAPVVGTYFPLLRGVRPNNMWAGNQDINTIDKKPVIYKEGQLIVANGSSGGGIMKADSLGRIVASLYDDNPRTELFGGTQISSLALGIEGRDFSVERFEL